MRTMKDSTDTIQGDPDPRSPALTYLGAKVDQQSFNIGPSDVCFFLENVG